MPESKEASIDALRSSLERRGVDTGPWWDTQVSLCLLGALVQFGARTRPLVAGRYDRAAIMAAACAAAPASWSAAASPTAR